MKSFKDKKIVIMGLGLHEQGSGGMAAQFFAKQGAKVLVTDLCTRKQLKLALERLKKYKNIKYVLGRHREEDFKKADLIFQNPSVPAYSPYLQIAQKAKIPIINDWSIFLSRHQPQMFIPPPSQNTSRFIGPSGKVGGFIGVTGTRGKSTTTALIYEMLKRHHSHIRANVRMRGKDRRVFLAGNLGVSPLSFIDKYQGEPIVAELSSWLLHHFPTARVSPNIAVVTNIMNDHLNKYRTRHEYIADKENIFRFQNKNDVVVLNYDNSYTQQMAKKAKGKIIWFSTQPFKKQQEGIFANLTKSAIVPSMALFVKYKDLQFRWRTEMLIQVSDIRLRGEHNLANIMAACAVAQVIGISREDVVAVLKSFNGLPNRLELVREINGVKYYNDTTATTPDATIAALKTLGTGEEKIILIAGGADKKLEYKELVKYIKRYCKALILLPGTATDKLKLEIGNWKLEIQEAQSMQEAVVMAKNSAEKGDIILLSPAAASFGLFKNEFDRGEQFVEEVGKLRG